MINIESLGQEYAISDINGNFIKNIQIIPHTDILDAALGEYTEEFGSFNNYLKKSVDVMTGFDVIDPYKVLWYPSKKEEVTLSEIIEYAVLNDYDKIILEYIEDTE